MANVKTRWGLLEDDDGDLSLSGRPVLEIESEGAWYIVTHERSGYVARWVDEEGESHEKTYASARGALDKARKSWGR